MTWSTDLRIAEGATTTHVVVTQCLTPADCAALRAVERVLPVVDAEVWRLHAPRVQELLSWLGGAALDPLLLPGGEAAKSLESFAALATTALSRQDAGALGTHAGETPALLAGALGTHAGETPALLAGAPGTDAGGTPALHASALGQGGVDRRTLVVVIGGGAVLDAGQFLAAVLLRGLDCVVLPTTLLAQLDAGVGGKCGLNAGARKNQIGVIRQPAAVLIETQFLGTLPPREMQSGLGELAKTALLAGGTLHTELCAWAQSNTGPKTASGAGAGSGGCRVNLPPDALIAQCVAFKAGVVQRDATERGERIILNAGHTVGHALESAALELGAPLSHGEAVALGLHAEAHHFAQAGAAAVDRLLHALGFEPHVSAAVLQRAAFYIGADKKRHGDSVRVPVIDAPGSVRIVSASIAECAAALSRIRTG